ncbi:sphingosine 1-phosphate receptor 2-like [Clavelina lepadiformis]|uniref:sphingosine 1-phosphate receptor 2-like n=1 Tax=Clavelina lepadiformis TaxID=159417 RepID=UPI0040432538
MNPVAEPEFGGKPEPVMPGVPVVEPEPESEPGTDSFTSVTDIEVFAEPEPPASSENYVTALAVVAAVIGTFIILENILVIYALVRGDPKHPKSLTYFIANLAVADIVAGIQLVWFTSIDYFAIQQKPKMYIIGMCALWLVTIVVSVIDLVIFALHRLRVARSKMHFRDTPKRAVLWIVLLSWVLPILILIVPPLAGWNCIHCVEKKTCEQVCSMILYPFTKSYSLMLSVMVIVVIIALFVIYGWMLFAVHSKVEQVKNREAMQRKETRMMQTVLFLLVLFTICILPVAIVMIVDYIQVGKNDLLLTAFQFTTVFSFLNSVCNPFLYVWKLPSMQNAMWKALGKNHRTARLSTTLQKSFGKRRESRLSLGSESSRFDVRKKSVETITLSKT